MQCACAILLSVSAPLCSIFPYYLINGTIFGKKVRERKMCFYFFAILVCNIARSKNISSRCHHKCTQTGVHVKCRYSCQIVMELEFSAHIFEKHSNIKFHENRLVEPKLYRADGRRDRHDEANCRFSQFCERA